MTSGSSILNASSLEPPSRKRLYIAVAIAALVVALAAGGWFIFRFAAERRTVGHFMDAVAAEDFQGAYQIWKPEASYTYQDFLGDWGTQGYYGPIQSYRLRSEQEPQDGGSGVIVTVEVSPVRPFPSEQDPQSAKTREVKLWVERKDQSIGFPP